MKKQLLTTITVGAALLMGGCTGPAVGELPGEATLYVYDGGKPEREMELELSAAECETVKAYINANARFYRSSVATYAPVRYVYFEKAGVSVNRTGDTLIINTGNGQYTKEIGAEDAEVLRILHLN